MKKITLLWVIIFTILFVGCTGGKEIIYKDNFIEINIPTELTEQIDTPKPPSKKEYLDANCTEREKLLGSSYVTTLGALSKANSKLGLIEEYVKNVKKITQ